MIFKNNQDNNNKQKNTRKGEPKTIETFRFAELLKTSETVIERNLKLYGVSIGVLVILQFLFLFFNLGNMYVLYGSMLFEALVTFVLKIIIFKKVDTGFDYVDNKRQKGNVFRQVLNLILIYVVFLIIVAILSVALVFIVKALSSILSDENIVMILLIALNLAIIPSTVLLLYISIIFDSLAIEVFIKNNIKFSAIKTTLKNINNGINGTLAKLLAGMGVSLILNTFVFICSSFSYRSVFMQVVFSLLLIMCNVFIWTYSYIVYMTSVTDKRS